LPDGQDPVSVSYDWSLRKWLPVARPWVASNGLSYAYSDRQGSLHVVDAASSADRSVNNDHLWAVVDYAPEGIYAAARASASQPPGGLWLIDAASGTARMIASTGDWEFVGAHTAYGLASPHYAPPNIVYGNDLVVLDLNTGRATTMYTRTDDTFRLLGLDSNGNPYIATWHINIGAGSAMMEVTAPGTVSAVQGGGIWSNVLADGDRTWFGEAYGEGVWLKDSAGVRRLAQVGYSGPGPQPAGGCR
jgi:hypothetical protein